jgi:hypothetical protein
MGDGSMLGGWLAGRRTHCGSSYHAGLVRGTDGVLALVDESDPDAAVSITAWRVSREFGLLAPTVRRMKCRVMVTPTFLDSPPLSPGDVSKACALVADRFQQEVADPEWIPLIRAGGGTHELPIQLGYLYNIAFAFALAVWLWSASWFPFAVRDQIRDGQRHERLGRGCCAGCGYDLRGIASAACPECGEPVGVIEAATMPCEGQE